MDWVKSSYCSLSNSCAEVAALPGGKVGVRSSEDPDGPVLAFTRYEWMAFLAGVHRGEFDRFGLP